MSKQCSKGRVVNNIITLSGDAIGGMQMHLGYLYVSAGKSIYRLKIKAYSTIRKLTDYKIVMKLPDTPSEIATDELGGKRYCYYLFQIIHIILRQIRADVNTFS